MVEIQRGVRDRHIPRHVLLEKIEEFKAYAHVYVMNELRRRGVVDQTATDADVSAALSHLQRPESTDEERDKAADIRQEISLIWNEIMRTDR